MVILLLILVLASNAVMSKREKPIMYNITVVSMLILTCLLTYENLDVTALSGYISFYGGLFNIKTFAELFKLLIFWATNLIIIMYSILILIGFIYVLSVVMFKNFIYFYRNIKKRFGSFLHDWVLGLAISVLLYSSLKLPFLLLSKPLDSVYLYPYIVIVSIVMGVFIRKSMKSERMKRIHIIIPISIYILVKLIFYLINIYFNVDLIDYIAIIVGERFTSFLEIFMIYSMLPLFFKICEELRIFLRNGLSINKKLGIGLYGTSYSMEEDNDRGRKRTSKAVALSSSSGGRAGQGNNSSRSGSGVGSVGPSRNRFPSMDSRNLGNTTRIGSSSTSRVSSSGAITKVQSTIRAHAGVLKNHVSEFEIKNRVLLGLSSRTLAPPIPLDDVDRRPSEYVEPYYMHTPQSTITMQNISVTDTKLSTQAADIFNKFMTEYKLSLVYSFGDYRRHFSKISPIPPFAVILQSHVEFTNNANILARYFYENIETKGTMFVDRLNNLKAYMEKESALIIPNGDLVQYVNDIKNKFEHSTNKSDSHLYALWDTYSLYILRSGVIEHDAHIYINAFYNKITEMYHLRENNVSINHFGGELAIGYGGFRYAWFYINKNDTHSIVSGETAYAFIKGQNELIDCFLHDPRNYKGSCQPMGKYLGASILEHLEFSKSIERGLEPKHTIPLNLEHLDELCLLELYLLYLRDKGLLNEMRNIGICNRDFAHWLINLDRAKFVWIQKNKH